MYLIYIYIYYIYIYIYICIYIYIYIIGGVFFIWTDSEGILESLLKELNGFHPSIKFTFDKSKVKVNFLDVVIKIKDGGLSTGLYSKPVGSHQ